MKVYLISRDGENREVSANPPLMPWLSITECRASKKGLQGWGPNDALDIEEPVVVMFQRIGRTSYYVEM